MRDPKCTRCKLHETAQFVCLIPPIEKNDIMIVGEAPGKREDETGTPFVGESGKLLVECLKEVGLERKDVFITNSVMCRPPGNRTPKKGEIKACQYWFQKQFSAVKPKYVLLLGSVALEQALGLKGIKKLRGKPIERDNYIYLPTFHPSFILRDPSQRGKFQADLQFFKDIIDNQGIPKEEGLNWEIINDHRDLKRFLDDCYGSVSYDIETTTLYPWAPEAKVNSLGFGTKDTQWILPAEHEYSKWTRDKLIEVLEIIKERCEKGELKLTMQNGKFDMLYTWVRYGIRLTNQFDTMLAHFLLDENDNHGLKYLSKVYFGAPEYDVDTNVKLGRASFEAMALYQAHDLFYTRKLKFKLLKQLKKEPEVYAVFREILMPCSNLFTEIEYRGVYIDETKMEEAERFLRNMKAEAETELNKYLPKKYNPQEFNWGSPKQLGVLLFEDLKIPIVEKTKTGAPSTSESCLKQIDHEMVAALLRFRESKQQLSFFIEGWKPFIKNHRLHPNFKLHGTVTGRLSCENPNLQQVPRDPRIRSLITAPPGWVLLEADLSQIELRIAAELSDEPEMIRCFRSGIDLHWRTMLKSLNSDIGAYSGKVLQTAEMYCMLVGLPADRTSVKILLKVCEANKNRVNTEKIISACCEYWQDKKARSREWGQPGRKEKSELERWLPDMATKVSEELLQSMWNYTEHLFASQGRGSKQLEKIQFSDALQVLSFIGPSVAQELLPDWKELRKKAKAVAFGYLYGMWWKKFKIYARDSYGVKISEEEAQQSRKDFFELYSALPQWHNRQKAFARKYGYVASLSGRKRRLPAAMSKQDTPERGGAERQAINSPVQSFANELNLMALIQLRKEFSPKVLHFVGTVHDAILMEVREDYVEKVYKRTLEVMSHPELLDKMDIVLNVPIEAEAKIGAWSLGKDLETYLEERE